MTTVVEDKAPKEPRKPDLNKFTAKDRQRHTGIMGMYGMIATGLMVVNPADAMIILGSADECAKSWVKVAKTNKKIGDTIDSMIAGTVWGGLITVHLGMIIAIMNNHGMSVQSLMHSKKMVTGNQTQEDEESVNPPNIPEERHPQAYTDMFTGLFQHDRKS